MQDIVGTNNTVNTTVVDASGNLYIGGSFTTVGGISANYVAKWDGLSWSALGSGMNTKVNKLTLDSKGQLYAGGDFTIAGGITANHVAMWNGAKWSALGVGVDRPVSDLIIRSGTDELFVGGNNGPFTIANELYWVVQWNGNSWSASGTTSLPAPVTTMAVDSMGKIYSGYYTATGFFIWDGAKWSKCLEPGGYIFALCADKSGCIYASHGGWPLDNKYYIAKWNGISWNNVGNTNGIVANTLTFDQNNNLLYIGGTFTTIGGITAKNIAVWNGTSLASVGGGANNTVKTLSMYKGTLYAGGDFTIADGISVNNIAKWDGSTWSPLIDFNTEQITTLTQQMSVRDLGQLMQNEVLYDHNQAPTYRLGVSNTGYLIMRNADGYCLEYGNVLNPYNGYGTNVQKFYGGVGCYSTKQGASYYNIIYGVASSNIPYLQELDMIPLRDNSSPVLMSAPVSTSTLPPSLAATPTLTYTQLISNYNPYIQRKAFGYNDANSNTCTAVALGIVLTYLDCYLDSQIVPANMKAEALIDVNAKDKSGVIRYPRAEALHKQLQDECGLGPVSYADRVVEGLYKYDSLNSGALNRELKVSWSLFSSTYQQFKNEININKPVMVTTTFFGDPSNFHSMAVYGVRESTDGSKEMCVHPGWYGSSYIKSDSNSSFYTNVLWVSIALFTYSYSFQYTTTPVSSTPPKLTAVTPISNSSIKLTWDTVVNAQYYMIYRSTVQNGTFTTIATVNAPTLTYTDLNVPVGQVCYYKIIACKTITFNNGIVGLPSLTWHSTDSNILAPVYYTITYNANLGIGAPNSQIKLQGVSLVLSSTKPSKNDCTFLGWATTSNAITIQYSSGATYSAVKRRTS